MSDDQISDVLVRLTAPYQSGPPPIHDLIAAGARKRRRRSLAAVAGVAAVIVAIIGTAAIVTGQDNDPNGTDPSVRQPVHPIPPDSRLVGVGHAAIAVPQGWATNKTGCGTPLADTVIINVTGVPACLIPRPPGVSDVDISVRETRPNYPSFTHANQIDIDGADARRTPVDCISGTGGFAGPGKPPRPVCTQAIWVPTESALFVATTPHAASTERLLDTVHIVAGRVAVPQSNLIGDPPGVRARFVRSAERLGLVVETTTKKASGFSHGSILGVSPPTGTIVRVGSTIHLTLAS